MAIYDFMGKRMAYHYGLMSRICNALLLFVFSITIVSCKQPDNSKRIRIIHAGSLSLVVKEIVEEYNRENPGIEFLTEAWGSKDGARQITELNKPCDVYISADIKIIEAFLFPDHATWGIPFAGNEMVLAYTGNSRFSSEIGSHNWHKILSRSDVFTARSSPDADPCGVRAVLLMLLSDHYYEEDGLSEILFEKDRNYVRPKEADLIALLQKRTVDYLYIYKSLAVQHGFNYLTLPDSINLSNPLYEEWYSTVSFETAGNSPDKRHTETGTSIVYGITIPKNAKNIEEAIRFIDYMLDPDKGGAIIVRNGQNRLPKASVKHYKNIPDELKKYAMPHEK